MPPKISGKAVKKAGKAQKKPTTDKKKKKKTRETYSLYIYKVLKQVHPETGISSKAMSILNNFVNDIFNELLVKLQDFRTTTYEQPSLAVRSKLQFDCSCPVNWPSTQSVKEPRLSPSTQAPTKMFDYLLLAAGSTLLHKLTFNFLKAINYFVSQF